MFHSVHEAHKLWIKVQMPCCSDHKQPKHAELNLHRICMLQGRHFNLSELLQDAKLAKELKGGSVAVFRLAPEDYHRYHSPVAGKMGATWHIPGSYYVSSVMYQTSPAC